MGTANHRLGQKSESSRRGNQSQRGPKMAEDGISGSLEHHKYNTSIQALIRFYSS